MTLTLLRLQITYRHRNRSCEPFVSINFEIIIRRCHAFFIRKMIPVFVTFFTICFKRNKHLVVRSNAPREKRFKRTNRYFDRCISFEPHFNLRNRGHNFMSFHLIGFGLVATRQSVVLRLTLCGCISIVKNQLFASCVPVVQHFC